MTSHDHPEAGPLDLGEADALRASYSDLRAKYDTTIVMLAKLTDPCTACSQIQCPCRQSSTIHTMAP